MYDILVVSEVVLSNTRNWSRTVTTCPKEDNLPYSSDIWAMRDFWGWNSRTPRLTISVTLTFECEVIVNVARNGKLTCTHTGHNYEQFLEHEKIY